MIDELTDYLDREAARVRVHDSLDDIEAGITRVPVRQAGRGSRWVAPALVGAAAAAVVLFGVAAGGTPAQQRAVAPAAAVGVAPPAGDAGQGDETASQADDGTAAAQDVTSRTLVELADDAQPVAASSPALEPGRVLLPDGATMQGLTPSCTTDDGLEFECHVEGYRYVSGYDDHGFDHTNEIQNLVTADEITSGACRAITADGNTWHCALGQRAIDLGLLLPQTLGQRDIIGYAAG